MTDLPARLAHAGTRVTFRAHRDDARAELREAVHRGYVQVLFTETAGGTEVGFRLDAARSDLSGARWEEGQGTLRLAGGLNLDGVPVQCVAEIDLASLEGTGRLEPQPA